MNLHSIFIHAIHSKTILNITVNSYEKGIIVRTCIPFDYGPSRRYKDGKDRYHLLDLDSPDGVHNLSILPEQLIDIKLSERNFHPEDYVHWTPAWIVKRDWGKCS